MRKEEDGLTKEKLELAMSCSEKELVRVVAKKMYKQKYGDDQNSRGNFPSSSMG